LIKRKDGYMTPYGVIFARKPTYKHHPNVLIENNSNLESWEKVKQILANGTPRKIASSTQDNIVLTTHPIKISYS